VLEIGAASGGNIIPLAARFPRAHFHGVDLAARHIEIGRQRIAELGLSNVTLEQGDITEADFGKQRFDYIICHGVFSWAPPTAQRAILKVCADTLSDTGVVAISYNVFPGWHTRNVIRDICLEHTRGDASPRQKVEAVRELLKNIAGISSDKGPYGAIIRAEAARLKTRPASYILGELLAAYNQPFHVREVMSQAAEEGLAYLGESDLMSSAPEYVAAPAAKHIRMVAGSDPAAIEQYIDIFSGRTFRRSLFTRAACPAQPPSSQRLLSLQITASPPVQSRDAPVEPANSGVQAMLAKHYPASVPVADLVTDQGSGPAALAELYEMLARGRATISTDPVTLGRGDQAQPNLWLMARADAVSGQPWVTNLLHAPVLLSPLLRCLAPRMNGATPRDQLAAALETALRSGALSESDLPRIENGDTANRLTSTVDRLVAHCARNALLAP
jgi:SAM-dependent methyltransferase